MSSFTERIHPDRANKEQETQNFFLPKKKEVKHNWNKISSQSCIAAQQFTENSTVELQKNCRLYPEKVDTGKFQKQIFQIHTKKLKVETNKEANGRKIETLGLNWCELKRVSSNFPVLRLMVMNWVQKVVPEVEGESDENEGSVGK